MHLLPFIAEYPHASHMERADIFCERAKDDYPEKYSAGEYMRGSAAALYIYRIEEAQKNTVSTGICAFVSPEDFAQRIKHHEKTILAKETQQIRLIQEWEAILKPVLLAHPHSEALHTWLNAFIAANSPFFTASFQENNQQHTFWEVAKPGEISDLQTLFAKEVPEAYIADGHHRATALARMTAENAYNIPGVYTACFPDSALQIGDFNRVVALPENTTVESLLKELEKVFDIKKIENAQKPAQKHAICLFFQEQWYQLHWKTALLQGVAQTTDVLLDAALLDQYVFGDLFGMTDIKNETRIRYVDSSKGLEGMETACRDAPKAGFVLYPVLFSDLRKVADAGGIMPPKSTFFEPRLKSGLLVARVLKKDSDR
jgi:uncharacterized protein (DUF1015 family)